MTKRARPPTPPYNPPISTTEYLHSQGKPSIYLSDDDKYIIIKHPDGPIEKKPCPPYPSMK